jgi:phosphoenolpyruvate synthase/pyruvate phosphate dikinase
MINFFFNKTKAEVLLNLKKKNLLFRIPDTIAFSVCSWEINRNKIIYQIIDFFKKREVKKIIIRSSCFNEDNNSLSNAGKYLSIPNVNLDKNFLKNSIQKVINSYDINHPRNEFIVQPMIQNVQTSGVIFTKDIETGSHYYVINYDDISGKTNTVTSGKGINSNRIIYIFKKAVKQIKSKRFRLLVKHIKDLETKIDNDNLDIEFLITKDFKFILLQARLITTKKKWKSFPIKFHNLILKKCETKIKNLSKKTTNIYGKSTIFGLMPDWNPAEIIGRYPSQLSYSLYRYLVTSFIWSKSRYLMGYKKVRKELMYEFCGQPYIDVRLSLNSFIPFDLNSSVSKKVINFCINKLKKNPYLHDKIEFELIDTCFNFTTTKDLKKKFTKILSKKEINSYLQKLTNISNNSISKINKFSIYNLEQKVELINKKFDTKNLHKMSNLQILNYCRNYGVLYFAIIARHAFIAKSFLNSLVKKKIFTNNYATKLEKSISTVTTDILNDMFLVKKKKLSKKFFMEKYGHLRPGTYDVTSLRYDEMKNFNFNAKKINQIYYKPSKKILIEINNQIKKTSLDFSADELINYIIKSLSLREYSKFVFTKYLSEILKRISKFSEKRNIKREEISHLDIKFLIKQMSQKNNLRIIKKEITTSKINKSFNHFIKLPSLIMDWSFMKVVPFQVNNPNFVTSKKTEGKFIYINKSKHCKMSNNRIILIENADPGYDWIFGFKILGLVTKYGGVNSHMAIRCAELGIPAVIGCGEQIFNDLITKQKIHFDCKHFKIF